MTTTDSASTPTAAPGVPDDGRGLRDWDGLSLAELLTLDEIAPRRYRSRHGDPNRNGRSYGGQVLGQAMRAASLDVDPHRAATMLQLLFLQGSDPTRPIEFDVAALQDGKRFTSRHVRGSQAGRIVFDANATFALPLDAPRHAEPAPAGASPEPPEELPTLPSAPVPWTEGLRRLGGYSLHGKPAIDFRIAEAEQQVGAATAGTRVRFWMKASAALPDDPAMQAAAFAYLSDWWLNFSALGAHMREMRDDQRLYVSSLNHGIWFHRPFRADVWLHVDSHSPCAEAGRGLSIASVRDRRGRLVATISQECLMAYA